MLQTIAEGDELAWPNHTAYNASRQREVTMPGTPEVEPSYYARGSPVVLVASKISRRVRARIYEAFMSMVGPAPDAKIIDVGVTADESYVEANFFEAMYPYKAMITATGVEDASALEKKYPGLRFVRTDAGALPFDDDEFDVAFSHAVIEHVGSADRQREFVAELLRVAKVLFLTTPDRWFPMEFHTYLPFIHWLPKPRHRWLLKRLGLTFLAQESNLNLLTKRELGSLFPATVERQVTSFRLLGLSSNLVVVASRHGLRDIKRTR